MSYLPLKTIAATVILSSTLATTSCALPGILWHAVNPPQETPRKNIHGYMLIDKNTTIQAFDLNNDGTIDEALIDTQHGKENSVEHLVAPDADTTKRAWEPRDYTREMTPEERTKLTELYKQPQSKPISE